MPRPKGWALGATVAPTIRRCAWCGGDIPLPTRKGRHGAYGMRTYCGQKCSQASQRNRTWLFQHPEERVERVEEATPTPCLSTHRWQVAERSEGGFWAGKCQVCSATTRFPVPEDNFREEAVEEPLQGKYEEVEDEDLYVALAPD